MRHRRHSRLNGRARPRASSSRWHVVSVTAGLVAATAMLVTCSGGQPRTPARSEERARNESVVAAEPAAAPGPVTEIAERARGVEVKVAPSPAPKPEPVTEDAPAPRGGEAKSLFANGGFEEGTAGWNWEQYKNRPEPGAVAREGAYEGEACYRFTMPGELSSRFIHTRAAPIEAGRDYEFAVALACENAPRKSLSLRILQWGDRPQPLGWVEVPARSGMNVLVQTGGTHDWKRFVVHLPAESIYADTTKLNVFIEKKPVGLGVVKIDALSLVARGRGTAAPAKGGGAPKKAAAAPKKVKRDVPNLLPGDTSFETGTNQWPGTRDGATAAHGASSLAIAADATRVDSPQYHALIEPGRPYTLSFFARADRGDTAVTFDAWHLRWNIMRRIVVKVSPTWARYEIPIPPQKVKRGVKLAVTKDAGRRVWLDAVQLEAGKATAFRPSEKLSVGFGDAGAPGNILFVGNEPVRVEVGVYNDRHPTGAFTFSYATRDFRGGEVARGRDAIEVARGKAVVKTLEVLKARTPGYYVTTVTVADGTGAEVKRGDVPFGVVRPPVVAGDDPASFFGLHGGMPLDVRARIGAKWTRSITGWRWLERRKGEITKTRVDYENVRRNHFHLMETLKVTLMPDWAKAPDGRVRDVNEYCAYVTTLVKRSAGLAKHFEIENEPYLVFPSSAKLPKAEAGRYYAEVLVAASEAVKRANRDAVVMADPGHDSPFAEEVLKRAIKDFDIYAIHPYAQARYIGANGVHVGPEAVEMRNKFLKGGAYLERFGGKQPIWVGELGWSLDVNAPYLSEHARAQAAYMARAMLLARSVPRVKRIMWFVARGCVERKHYEYGLWRGAATPLPSAVAYATLARVLHHAKPVRPLFESDLRAYAFERADGTPVVALWKWRGEPVEVSVDVAPSRVRVLDMVGAEVDAGGNDDAKLVLEAGECPVFVEGAKIRTDDLCAKVGAAKVNMEPVTISVLLGDASAMSGFVKNNLPRAVDGTLTLATPGGPEQKRPMRLGASEAKSFDFALRLRADAPTSKGVDLVLRFESDAGAVTRKVPLRAEPCVRKSVRLDGAGSLAGWRGVPQVELTEREDVQPPDPGIGWDGPDDLSVTASVAWDDERFYFAATVTDDTHAQEYEGGDVWKGDSIQIAFDTKNDAQQSRTAYDKNDCEFSVALTRRGPSVFIHHAAGGRPSGRVAENVKAVVVRKGTRTTYQVAFPWSELAPLSPLAGRMFGFNFIVNDNDGAGRAYWMGLSPGIGEMKAPFLYRKFVLSDAQ